MAGPRDQPLEALEVELAGLDRDPVAGAVRLDPVGADRLPEAVDVDLQRGRGRCGRLVAPECIDERVAGDDLAGAEEEGREQRALLRRSQRDVTPIGERLERAKDVKLSCRFDPLNGPPSGS
jgi:hypothetical protein